jgi:hypothetical protein
MPRRYQTFKAYNGGNFVYYNDLTNTSSLGQRSMIGRSGRYDKWAGGRKVYGNPDQGDSMLAFPLTTDESYNCVDRELYVAVTAVNNASVSLKLELSSVPFNERGYAYNYYEEDGYISGAFYGLTSRNIMMILISFISLTIFSI